MRPLALAGLCALLVGCDCSDPGHCGFTATGEQPAAPAALEGRPLVLRIPLGVAPNNPVDCANVVATSVSVTLLDPLDAPVMNTATLTSPELANAAAEVRFTPPGPGPYHLTARFEPNLNTVQFDFPVAVDRSDAGVHAMAAPGGCDVFDVAAGVPLCQSVGPRRLTAWFPDGGFASVDAGRFSVDEAGRVWTLDAVDGQTIHVYELDAGAFVERATQPDEVDPPLALVARGGSAAVVRPDVLELLRLDGGAFTAEEIPHAQFNSSEELCVQFIPPSSTVIIDLTGGINPLFLNAFGETDQQISGLSTFLGADDDGVWWSSGTSLSVVGAILENDAGVVHSIPYTGQLSFPAECPESQQTPITSEGGFVPRLSQGQIILEAYPVIGPPLGANSRLVWGIDGGTLYWFDRPALP